MLQKNNQFDTIKNVTKINQKKFGGFMNKILNFILIGIFVLGTTLTFASDTPPSTLKSVISRVVAFPVSHHKEGGFYILDNDYALYFTSKKDKVWKEGDAVIVEQPFADMDNVEMTVKVKNVTQNHKHELRRAGWAAPHLYKIAAITSHSDADGMTYVDLQLDHGAKWQFAYNDQKPKAQSWQVGDYILLIVNPLEGYSNPFPFMIYHTDYEYELINITHKQHFAGINAHPL